MGDGGGGGGCWWGRGAGSRQLAACGGRGGRARKQQAAARVASASFCAEPVGPGAKSRSAFSGGGVRNFRRLKVYCLALDLSTRVREITTRFPADERFVLVAQFRRAVDGIVLNIAEGAGNDSEREFA